MNSGNLESLFFGKNGINFENTTKNDIFGQFFEDFSILTEEELLFKTKNFEFIAISWIL